jgi:phosphatidate cytidylyltransferase
MKNSAQAAEKSDLPTRFAVGVVLIGIAVVVTYMGGLPFRVLAAAAAAMMLLEWADMHRVRRFWTWLAILLLVVPLIAVAQYLYPAQDSNPAALFPDMIERSWQGFAAVGALGVLLAIFSLRPRMGWGFIYVGVPAFALIVLNWAWAELVLWAFIVTWSTDIFAYFAGRSIGGAKLAPRTSPNKTWSGLVGGMVGAGVAAAVAGHLLQVDPVFHYLGAPFGLLAQLGDLYESSVKRRLGVKDSGHILPGHGGVLDRLDGLLPVALATFAVLAALSLDRL